MGVVKGERGASQNKRSDDTHKVRGRFLASAKHEAEQVSPFPP